MADIASIAKTTELLNKYRFHLKKGYGQNFLIDGNILRKIVSGAEITKQTAVIEIGPGIGSLTQQLAKAAGLVIAYEIDRALQPLLSETLAEYDNVTVIFEDILKADVGVLINTQLSGYQDIAVVANLPYYITTPILMKLIEERLPINRFCVMMQKEVALRLCGGPNSKEYNGLTIAVQYYAIPKIMMNVPKTVFIPNPNVDSAVLKLDVRKEPAVKVSDEDFFFEVVKGSFIQRRKTIFNNLKQSFKDMDKDTITAALEKAGINPSARAESLTIEQFAKLSEAMIELKKEG